MFKDLFRKPKYVTVHADTAKKDIPEGLWQKCPECNEILYSKELEKYLKTCVKCGYSFRMGARERIKATVDEGTFVEIDADMTSANPLSFSDYPVKIAKTQEATKLKEAIVTGEAAIDGKPVVVGAMDASFVMGSMGSVVGEKVARAVERAIERRIPLIVFSASGGARMQEGIISLMQMAKTCGALARLHEAGVLYITVFTDPTTGGVTASFASMGDIVLAEPGAVIGFTGPRVIEQTIRQT
ncbi:MAG TPA: acetyl-CoA carboxylase, carboxyltransferase subunit beta, partial [Desulfobacteria bacterium]|nr:acetyl-CoA carboxylase, carboxyltransferase subunit beta [Desulfobacteria bacterium]